MDFELTKDQLSLNIPFKGDGLQVMENKVIKHTKLTSSNHIINVNARNLATALLISKIPNRARVITMDHSNGYLPSTCALTMISN